MSKISIDIGELRWEAESDSHSKEELQLEADFLLNAVNSVSQKCEQALIAKNGIPTSLETALLQLNYEQKQELLNWLLVEPYVGILLEDYLKEQMK